MPMGRTDSHDEAPFSRFSWVADDTKIIHVEGGINTRKILNKAKS